MTENGSFLLEKVIYLLNTLMEGATNIVSSNRIGKIREQVTPMLKSGEYGPAIHKVQFILVIHMERWFRIFQNI